MAAAADGAEPLPEGPLPEALPTDATQQSPPEGHPDNPTSPAPDAGGADGVDVAVPTEPAASQPLAAPLAPDDAQGTKLYFFLYIYILYKFIFITFFI